MQLNDNSLNTNYKQRKRKMDGSNSSNKEDTIQFVENFITHRLQLDGFIGIYDIFNRFPDTSPKTAKLLLARFESRTSTYDSYPIDNTAIVPPSSLAPIHSMLLPSRSRRTKHHTAQTQTRADTVSLSPIPPDIEQMQQLYLPDHSHSHSNSHHSNSNSNSNSNKRHRKHRQKQKQKQKHKKHGGRERDRDRDRNHKKSRHKIRSKSRPRVKSQPKKDLKHRTRRAKDTNSIRRQSQSQSPSKSKSKSKSKSPSKKSKKRQSTSINTNVIVIHSPQSQDARTHHKKQKTNHNKQHPHKSHNNNNNSNHRPDLKAINIEIKTENNMQIPSGFVLSPLQITPSPKEYSDQQNSLFSFDAEIAGSPRIPEPKNYQAILEQNSQQTEETNHHTPSSIFEEEHEQKAVDHNNTTEEHPSMSVSMSLSPDPDPDPNHSALQPQHSHHHSDRSNDKNNSSHDLLLHSFNTTESMSITPSPRFLEGTDDGDDSSSDDGKDPHEYINYDNTDLDTWFAKQKYSYIIAIQECVADLDLKFPIVLAEIVVIYSILLPGCYTLTGLLFPPARNENDLFAEYANQETGYEQASKHKGIQYKRKKPMINIRRPENNTASLWLDEDGTICGFRCIWVHGMRGKLMVDQKFNVLQGCWSLMGEITITFEQWDVEDEFEGYLAAETFSGVWTAGKELYGEFQWFITAVESFYLSHNIEINLGDGDPMHGDSFFDDPYGLHTDSDANIIINDHAEEDARRHRNHHHSEDDDAFDIDAGDEFLSSSSNHMHHHHRHILIGKLFDIEINESLTITCKFLHNEHVPEEADGNGNDNQNSNSNNNSNSSYERMNMGSMSSNLANKSIASAMIDAIEEDMELIKSEEDLFGDVLQKNLSAKGRKGGKKSRHKISESKTVFLPWNVNQYEMSGRVLEISEKGDIDDEVIGYGQWFNFGKISFPMIKYHSEKLMLSFEGCTDGKKVLGRLCIYHDNSTPKLDSFLQSSMSLSRQRSANSGKNHTNLLTDNDGQEIDIGDESSDDDDIDLGKFFVSEVADDMDEEEEEEDDDERISFVQMIVVSPIADC